MFFGENLIDGRGQFGVHSSADLLTTRLRQPALVDQDAFEPSDRVARPPLLQFLGSHVRLGIVLRVPEHAIGLGDDHSWPAARPGPVHGLAGGLVYLEHIVAVHRAHGQAVGFGGVRPVLDGRGPVASRPERPAIVLEHE